MHMEITSHKSRYFRNDVAFNALYTDRMQSLAGRHWTPLHIAKLATGFLGKRGKVLDIGSGVGTFCLAAGYYAPDMEFVGVEQRAYLVHEATEVRQELGISNVSFLNANFTQLDFRQYDHFYFFNSFFENLDEDGRIDDKIEYSEALYEYYVRYLRNELQQMPRGTKIVTYHSLMAEVPVGYELVDTLESGDLRFWRKA